MSDKIKCSFCEKRHGSKHDKVKLSNLRKLAFDFEIIKRNFGDVAGV
jgi:hypothetical protein